jgi:hypothetical protein
MNLGRKKKIVLLGMMTKMPVAGVVWQNLHYLVGFQRLGYDVYYVEQHGRTPSMFMETEHCDGSGKAANFIASVMNRFDLGDRWCYHALHDDGRYYGLNGTQLRQLFDSAELIINLHGGTEPLPEHVATGRLIYIETDPVELEIELHDNVQATIDFLTPHCAFFTFGENLGYPDCRLPVSERFKFLPTRQPVVMDFWESPRGSEAAKDFTTVGNWRQPWRQVRYEGQRYTWSKDVEFMKFIDLPSRTAQSFELALGSCTPEVKQQLESAGWRVRDAIDLSSNLDAYRIFITDSRGEFTVAKEQNVVFRSGWFSDRSATYLAAGRPVITQETGFSNILPTGQGLFAFTTMEEILSSIETINADYEKHSRKATEIAKECFSHEIVLGRLLEDLGIADHGSPQSTTLASTEKPAGIITTA